MYKQKGVNMNKYERARWWRVNEGAVAILVASGIILFFLGVLAMGVSNA